MRGSKQLKEWLRQTVDNSNMCGPTFWLKKVYSNFIQIIKLLKDCNPLDFCLPTRNLFTTPYSSPNLQNLLNDRLWVPLLYVTRTKSFEMMNRP